MTKNIAAFVAGSVFTLGAVAVAQTAAPKRATYNDSLYGFAIDAPRFAAPDKNTMILPVTMAAPPENGFNSAINVGVQQVTTNRQGVRQGLTKQFEGSGFKINSAKDLTVSGRDAVLFDYEGKQQGKDVRILALVVVDKERIHLVNCTAPKDSFARYEPEFRASLDSFRLTTPAPAPAAADAATKTTK